MSKKLVFIWFIVSAVALSSCSKYQRLLKGSDFEAKYEAAEKYYAKEDYYRALQLLDELIIVYRGTERAERVYYLYAKSHFKQEDYLLANYHLKYFARTFPKSPHAEEALFLSAYCSYLSSPIYSLDQTSTFEALKEIQIFINLYPNSEYMPRCNEMVDELRFKLQKKDFETAMLYLNIQDFKAAIFSFDSFLKDYPASSFREEAMFNLVKAHYMLASRSVVSKQLERYTEAVEAYEKFISAFPSSSNSREAAGYNRQAQRMIANLSN